MLGIGLDNKRLVWADHDEQTRPDAGRRDAARRFRIRRAVLASSRSAGIQSRHARSRQGSTGRAALRAFAHSDARRHAHRGEPVVARSRRALSADPDALAQSEAIFQSAPACHHRRAVGSRLCLRGRRHPRAFRIRWRFRSGGHQRSRWSRRLRHDRMARGAALVRRQHWHVRRLSSGRVSGEDSV